MVCACYLLFQLTYFAISLGYPLYSFYILNKAGKVEEKWIYYFFIWIVLYFAELTVLFPLKWLLGKIDFCMFPTVKALFALWLYYPEKNGIQLIENLIGEHLVKAFEKANKIVGKFAIKIGIPNRENNSQDNSYTPETPSEKWRKNE